MGTLSNFTQVTSMTSRTLQDHRPGHRPDHRPEHQAHLSWAHLGLSATLVVALSGALLTLAQAQPMPGRGMAGGPGAEGGAHHAMAHRMGPGMAGSPMLSDRMLDSVGASPDQKTRVKAIMDRAHDEMRQQHAGDRALHQQLMGIMAAPQIDAAAAEGLRRQLQSRHDEASKKRLQAMLDASAVLTPEQRQKLSERAKARHELMQRHQRERQALEPRS